MSLFVNHTLLSSLSFLPHLLSEENCSRLYSCSIMTYESPAAGWYEWNLANGPGLWPLSILSSLKAQSKHMPERPRAGTWQSNDDTHLHMGGVGRTQRSESPVCYDWTGFFWALRACLKEPVEVMKWRREIWMRRREKKLLKLRKEARESVGEWEREREKTDGTKGQLRFSKSALGEKSKRGKTRGGRRKERKKGTRDRKQNKSIASVVYLLDWQFWVWRAAESPVSPDDPSRSSGRTDVPWSPSQCLLLHQDAWLGALSGACVSATTRWVKVGKKEKTYGNQGIRANKLCVCFCTYQQ